MDSATNSATTLAKGSSRSTQSRNDARSRASTGGATPAPATGLVPVAPSDGALAISRGKISEGRFENQSREQRMVNYAKGLCFT